MVETASVDRDGVGIAYEVRGDAGPWVVLVHGLGYHRRTWGEEVLAGLAATCRVIAIDNRGVGDSDAPPGPYTVELLADDIAAVIEAVGVSCTDSAGITVVGTSLGGAIVQTLVDQRPDLATRVVLVAPLVAESLIHPAPSVHTQADANIGEGRAVFRGLLDGSLAVTDLDPGMARRFTEAALGGKTLADRPGLVDEILALRMAKPTTPLAWLAQDHAGAAYRYAATAPVLGHPTLLVVGEDDAVVPPAAVRALADHLADARYVELPGVGHVAMLEVPARFVELVTTFALTGEVLA